MVVLPEPEGQEVQNSPAWTVNEHLTQREIPKKFGDPLERYPLPGFLSCLCHRFLLKRLKTRLGH